MFATILYNNDSNEEAIVLPESAACFGGRRPARLACLQCRAKKVKCTGEKTGCMKCGVNNIECVYPTSSERGSQGNRRQSNVGGSWDRNNPDKTRSSSTQTAVKDKNRSGRTSPGNQDYRPFSSLHSRGNSHAASPERDVEMSGSASGSSTSSSGKNKNGNQSMSSNSSTGSSSGKKRNISDNEDRLDRNNRGASPLLSPSLSLSLTCEDPLDSATTLPFDIHPGDLSLGVGDGFDYDPEQLRSPTMHQFYNLDLSTPASSVSATPFGGPETPQLFHTSAGLPGSGAPTVSNTLAAFSLQAQSPLGENGQVTCSCSQSAMHMLEELELKEHDGLDSTMGAVLSSQKMVLGKLQHWLECERCLTPRATAMLLALILERLTLRLEKGLAHYVRDRKQARKAEQEDYGGLGVVCGYQIESRHEHDQVMRVLLLTKGKELANVIARFKGRTMLDSMLTGTEMRATRIVSELTSWEG